MNNKKSTDIKNVADFLNWVKDDSISSKTEGVDALAFDPGRWYYRGQSNKDWPLKPSVLRIKEEEVPLNEHYLLKRANLILWNEASHLNSCLEKMIFFQDYGLPTRLLDVTFNPLIALYMACSEKREQTNDGIVYCGCRVDGHNHKIANLSAKYVFEKDLQSWEVNFNSFVKKENVNIDDFLLPLFVESPFSNPRIEAQNGAFIMSPLFIKGSGDSLLLNREGFEKTDIFEDKVAIIPCDFKESILRELFVLGISDGSIYKDIDKKVASIVTEERWKSNKFNIQL